MRSTYSLFEAKAKLSAIGRHVREGHHVIVTVDGVPVVEMRPATKRGNDIGARLEVLADRGVLVRPRKPKARLGAVARRPGALKRFLADREEGESGTSAD